MIRTERLWELAGVDIELIRCCSPSIGRCFQRLGLAILAVGLLSLVACGYAFAMLFDNWFIAGLFAIFFAGLISLIYKMILYSIQKPTLPVGSEARAVMPFMVWALFLLVVAIITAHTLAVLWLTIPLNSAVEAYRQQLLTRFEVVNHAYYDHETRQLQAEIEAEKKLPMVEGRLDFLKRQLAAVSQKDAAAVNRMSMELRNASFFAYRLSLLHRRYSGIWTFTACIWGVLLLPLILQQVMLRSGSYYRYKRKVDYDLVVNDYQRFKHRYREVFLTHFDQTVHYSEPYEDPPFNTRRKQAHYDELPEAELLSILYEKP